MRTLLAPLLGFALFGAVFAAVYYSPGEEERELVDPKFRIDPGEVKKDRLWETARGENVTVNITVLKGGPVGVFIINMDDVSEFISNGTIHGAELIDRDLFLQEYSNRNVTGDYNFTMFAPGTRDYGLIYVSGVERPEGYEEFTREEREPHVTELAVEIRYTQSEAKSLVLGYVFALPSLLLVAVAFWMKWRKRGRPMIKQGLTLPRDKDL